MIWRIRERSAFTRLTAQGRRARAGVLWCTYVLDPTATPPRVAFAIGRACGPAVVRNRVRRRLRALLATHDLAPGWYLFGVRPGSPSAATPDFTELTFDLEQLLRRVRGPSA